MGHACIDTIGTITKKYNETMRFGSGRTTCIPEYSIFEEFGSPDMICSKEYTIYYIRTFREWGNGVRTHICFEKVPRS